MQQPQLQPLSSMKSNPATLDRFLDALGSLRHEKMIVEMNKSHIMMAQKATSSPPCDSKKAIAIDLLELLHWRSPKPIGCIYRLSRDGDSLTPLLISI
ncbi:hypothetical protein Cni_G01651 [Canna indica]|uniref:Uncharacterized protein n=1 Tax=Canna indica TaxID=4628 RepID=A0AAQ3JMV6_9LILI|nr:hypothetical protein Cni_G01651 [Canna indica]